MFHSANANLNLSLRRSAVSQCRSQSLLFICKTNESRALITFANDFLLACCDIKIPPLKNSDLTFIFFPTLLHVRVGYVINKNGFKTNKGRTFFFGAPKKEHFLFSFSLFSIAIVNFSMSSGDYTSQIDSAS